MTVGFETHYQELKRIRNLVARRGHADARDVAVQCAQLDRRGLFAPVIAAETSTLTLKAG